jgi:hypothetical protein
MRLMFLVVGFLALLLLFGCTAPGGRFGNVTKPVQTVPAIGDVDIDVSGSVNDTAPMVDEDGVEADNETIFENGGAPSTAFNYLENEADAIQVDESDFLLDVGAIEDG